MSAADEEESGFTVRDRRRISTPAEEVTPPQQQQPAAFSSAAPAAPATTGMEFAGAPEEDLEPEFDGGPEDGIGGVPDVYQVLVMFLNEMRTLSLVRLGLIAPPDAPGSLQDLAQAKVAIDTMAFLAGQLDAVVSPEERLPLRAMISDLQLAYVEQSRNG